MSVCGETCNGQHGGLAFVEVVDGARFSTHAGFNQELRPGQLAGATALFTAGCVAFLSASSLPSRWPVWIPAIAWFAGLAGVFFGLVWGSTALGAQRLERFARKVSAPALTAWWAFLLLSYLMGVVAALAALGGATLTALILWATAALGASLSRSLAGIVLTSSRVISSATGKYRRSSLDGRHVVWSLYGLASVAVVGVIILGAELHERDGFVAFPLVSIAGSSLAAFGWALRCKHEILQAEEDMRDAVTRALSAAEVATNDDSDTNRSVLALELRLLGNAMSRPMPVHWTHRAAVDVWLPLGYVVHKFTGKDALPKEMADRHFHLYAGYRPQQLSCRAAEYLAQLRDALRSSSRQAWLPVAWNPSQEP